jgi:hypothetical protein
MKAKRVARFFWLAGKEFIPDPVKIPFALARHVRDCFLVTSTKDRLALYADLAETDDEAKLELENLILQEWSNVLPAGRTLPANTTDVVRGLVESLRVAGDAHRGGRSEEEQLRCLGRELASRVLGGRQSLPAAALSGPQRELGRLVVSSALRAEPQPDPVAWALPSIENYEIKRFLKEGGFGPGFTHYEAVTV